MSRRNDWDGESPLTRVRLSTAAQQIYESQAQIIVDELINSGDIKDALESKLLEGVLGDLGLSKWGGRWRIDADGIDTVARRLAVQQANLADGLISVLKLDTKQVVLSAPERKEIIREAKLHYYDVIRNRMK